MKKVIKARGKKEEREGGGDNRGGREKERGRAIGGRGEDGKGQEGGCRERGVGRGGGEVPGARVTG